MGKGKKIYGLSKAIRDQILKNPEAIKLPKGGYQIPLPTIRYKRSDNQSVSEFHKTIERDFKKYVNFVMLTYKSPYIKIEITDQMLFDAIVYDYRRSFASFELLCNEDFDFIRNILTSSMNNFKRSGYNGFLKWMKHTYKSEFVSKAKFSCHKYLPGDKNRKWRSATAHHAHKVAKTALMFDMFMNIPKKLINKLFRLSISKNGKKVVNLSNHSILMERFNKLLAKHMFHGSKRSSFFSYIKELLSELQMTLVELHDMLVNGRADLSISKVERIYDCIAMAKCIYNISQKNRLISRFLDKFIFNVKMDVGWDCCVF